jgi:NADP-dependent 3-hydroxy acid dehydrogenase YdfG
MEGTSSERARVAVVTGASSGIGAATARALAAAGMRVALLARRSDRIEALAAELDAAVPITADVTDADSVAAAARQVEAELGGADLLVNNAGTMFLGQFDEERAAETRRMVEVNLLGAMTTTAAFLPQLRRAAGDVVNISSLAGRTADRGFSVYNATKWGLNGWTEALRKELAPTVRVLLVAPGMVASELGAGSSDGEAQEKYAAIQERTGPLQPEDVAGVIAYAVSLPHRVALADVVVVPTAQR